MSKKSILLTGATGYLGSELLRYWIDQGHDLIVLKRSTSSLKRIYDLESRFVSYDVDKPDWEQSFNQNNIDFVVHVAATYGRNGESLSEILETNVLFPIRLLDLAIQAGVKYFINTSSSLPKEINDYALSKAQFQEWIKQKKDKIHAVNLVLEYFYGPGDEDWKFISMVVKKLKENAPSIKFTSGLQKRDFIYISDVVSAYDIVLNKIEEIETGKNIPVGLGESISIKELAEMIKRYSENTKTILNFGLIDVRSGEASDLWADISQLNKLYWSPSVSLEKGIQSLF